VKNSAAGFSLIELLVAISLVLILGAISAPYFFTMRQNASYREAARTVASAMRDARTQAVATNLQHRLVFDLPARTIDIDRATTDPPPNDWQLQTTFGPFAPNVRLRSGADCSVAGGTTEIAFNPNGTTRAAEFICVFDPEGNRFFRVGIASVTTGRVTIQRPVGATDWN
jgi:prepilin-type N-terminal cleavage/methylation domain-containing protein